MTSHHVAIVGGGYSGAMLAVQLLKSPVIRVTLIERRPEVARGAAYSTASEAHLLNVRAARMSALPEDSGHFSAWIARQGGDGLSFGQRKAYGDYLQQIFAEAAAAAGDRLHVVRDEVTGIERQSSSERLSLAGGEVIEADRVVLALGNMPPGENPTFRKLGEEVYAADPWSWDLGEGVEDSDTILLVGTGLTAADAALTLDERGFGGRIIAISRRGLSPRSHDRTGDHPPGLPDQPKGELSQLLKRVRSDASKIGWRAAVDQLRPHTQPMWAEATAAQRRRFLTHLRPYWDVHRHRIAPEIADRIDRMRGGGRLQILAGRIVSADANESGAAVRWTPRGTQETSQFQARKIVNCTGPQLDIMKSKEPLVRQLLGAGRIRPDVCRIGIDVSDDLRVLSADGEPSESLYAVGPVTRGALWEIVAVPDLRLQVKKLAEQLAGAQN